MTVNGDTSAKTEICRPLPRIGIRLLGRNVLGILLQRSIAIGLFALLKDREILGVVHPLPEKAYPLPRYHPLPTFVKGPRTQED